MSKQTTWRANAERWFVRRMIQKGGEAVHANTVSAPIPPLDLEVRLGEETSDELFASVVAAIGRKDHVLLIGPRGSGKSYAARKAMNMAEASNMLVPGTSITAQGNKELPRDYFFEPEFEFSEEGGRVKMRLRQPPLFRFAAKDADGGLKLAMVGGTVGKTNMVTRYIPTLQFDKKKVGKFVLFLDEINRFNDGVLDSLLLLLEEGCVIYQGKVVELPVVVIATMNPPGYDMSARSLSPPLMSRFNIVKQLYTAGPITLAKTMLPQQLDSQLRYLPYELFAAAILAFWGEFNPRRPSAAYLAPQAQEMLLRMSKVATEKFRQDLTLISEKSNYGPDARGARDWIQAVDRRMSGSLPPSFEEIGRIAVTELGDAIANKLVLNFSPEARPEEFRNLMKSLANITYEIFSNVALRNLVFKEFF